MKNTHIILIILASILGACNDFLDVPATDRITDEDVWSDPKLVDAALAELYQGIQFEDFNYYMGWDVHNIYLSTITDDCIGSYQSGPLGTKDAGAYVYDNEWFGWWGYAQVRHCNTFLQKLEDANLTYNEKKLLAVEVRFIRAYHYFNMVKRYGGVPLITEVQVYENDESLSELQVERNKEKEIWDFISMELDNCADQLPAARNEQNRARATKWAALALKSRAMLYAASIAKYGTVQLNGLVGVDASAADDYWEQALLAAESIINEGSYHLYNKFTDKSENYYQLFLDKNNGEYIFWEEFSVPDKAHNYDLLFTPYSFTQNGYGCGFNPTIEFVEAYEYLDDADGKLKIRGENGELIKYDSPLDLFENKDPRLSATVYLPMSSCRGDIVEIRRGIYDQGNFMHYDDLTRTYGQGVEEVFVVGKDGIIDVNDPTKTGFYVKKFYNEELQNIKGNQSDQYWPAFRLAEMYLNAAEAAYELNQKNVALTMTNKIRERAGIKLLTADELTLDRIRNERRVELAFENHRFWDLKRWRTAHEVLNYFETKALWPWLDWSDRKYFFTIGDAPKAIKVFLPRHYYLKFSETEMNTNPKLIQNPGF
ncbi:RagB/SusD family nutrient uptake outer membrane protein [Sunxiuqinia sp. A32]|uniref:RagB/SusD family nutrient uptake outer membrane protein n=1 Tax=Sunxiuqinia sp. A32 TaxID=3461496 RepID=UPI0040465D4A